jgi:hypothetical protein
MRSHLYSLAAVLLICSLSLAADEPKPAGPKTPAAQAAIAKHVKALADAAQAYQDAKRKADQELVAALKKVQADVMKAGGANALAEGNAIQAVIDKTAQETRPTSPAGDLVAKFTAKKWAYNGGSSVITYTANGIVESKVWAGKTGTWKQLDANSIEQHEPGGAIIKITFDDEVSGALWVYQGKHVVAYAVAQ